MDSSSIPSYTRHWRTIYQHKQQWHRYVLDQVVHFHTMIVLTHSPIVWAITAIVLGLSPTRPLLLHLITILLSLAARVSWSFMFRNPDQFVGLRRPGVTYRWTVLIVCRATAVPNICVHAVILERSLPELGEEEASLMVARVRVLMSVLQIALYFGACAICAWMVWRFLMNWEDETYDPCVKSELDGLGIRRAAEESEPALEPYSDTPQPPVSRVSGTAATNFLAAAYTKQRIKASIVVEDSQQRDQRDIFSGSITEQEHSETTFEDQVISASKTLIFAEARPVAHPRCPTVASYEYIDRNHTGLAVS